MPNPLIYDESDLTASSGLLDHEQLRQEFQAASDAGAFSSTPVTFSTLNSEVDGASVAIEVYFSGVPDGTDEAAADALVAAHTAAGGVPDPGEILRQSITLDLAANLTTAAGSFPGSTLLSQSVTVSDGGILLIAFTAGTSNSSNNNSNRFRLVVDGVVRRGASARLSGGANTVGCVSIVHRVAGLAPGARVVDIQWYATGGTAQVRPLANPDGEHATLVIQEVTV